jgi:hypothetical protein
MTRGAVVLFVGVLSVIFLHRRLWFYQYEFLFHFIWILPKILIMHLLRWFSLLTVMLGTQSHFRPLQDGLLFISFY